MKVCGLLAPVLFGHAFTLGHGTLAHELPSYDEADRWPPRNGPNFNEYHLRKIKEQVPPQYVPPLQNGRALRSEKATDDMVLEIRHDHDLFSNGLSLAQQLDLHEAATSAERITCASDSKLSWRNYMMAVERDKSNMPYKRPKHLPRPDLQVLHDSHGPPIREHTLCDDLYCEPEPGKDHIIFGPPQVLNSTYKVSEDTTVTWAHGFVSDEKSILSLEDDSGLLIKFAVGEHATLYWVQNQGGIFYMDGKEADIIIKGEYYQVGEYAVLSIPRGTVAIENDAYIAGAGIYLGKMGVLEVMPGGFVILKEPLRTIQGSMVVIRQGGALVFRPITPGGYGGQLGSEERVRLGLPTDDTPKYPESKEYIGANWFLRNGTAKKKERKYVEPVKCPCKDGKVLRKIRTSSADVPDADARFPESSSGDASGVEGNRDQRRLDNTPCPCSAPDRRRLGETQNAQLIPRAEAALAQAIKENPEAFPSHLRRRMISSVNVGKLRFSDEDFEAEYPIRHQASVIIAEGCAPGRIGTEVVMDPGAQLWVSDTFDIGCGNLTISQDAHIRVKSNGMMLIGSLHLYIKPEPMEPSITIESGATVIFKPDATIRISNRKTSTSDFKPYKEFFMGRSQDEFVYFCSNSLMDVTWEGLEVKGPTTIPCVPREYLIFDVETIDTIINELIGSPEASGSNKWVRIRAVVEAIELSIIEAVVEIKTMFYKTQSQMLTSMIYLDSTSVGGIASSLTAFVVMLGVVAISYF